MEIRNIAIIAHVDHGKTKLTDALMQETGMVKEGFSMDSNAIELERGITIYSKNASLFYKGVKINIVDTPGHADFGSEVERVLRSIDSVLLVVDAQEGPMPQTRFVLKKSLELGLKPIVVINKIDKPAARPEWTHNEVLALFMDLGATNEQLDFTTVYAIAKDGVAKLNLSDELKNLEPLLNVILKEVPPASSESLAAQPFRMQPFNLGYDNFLGRLAIGRIYEGGIQQGENVFIKKMNGETRQSKITKIFTFEGMERKEAERAESGDIVMIAGIPDVYIGETICKNADQELLPAIAIDEPTICLNFLVNNSPFAGREGKFVTTRQLKERLERELEVNVGLRIDFFPSTSLGQVGIDSYKVYGRGELHIAILLENMRREGYEMQVSQPQVIFKEDTSTGSVQILEPFEEIIVDVPDEAVGGVIDKLSKRKGIMTHMYPEHGHNRIIFDMPTRGFLGYRGEFIIDTRGEGILSSRVTGFRPYAGAIQKRNVGSMSSMASGKALGFSLANLQDRGTLYIGPGTEIYEGMVIGNVSKGDEMVVNPTKGKELTNMRASGSDDAIMLTPPLLLTLERGLEIMNEDEYLEVTPKSVRLRKQYLTENDRVRAKRTAGKN
ncbi:MAG: translational GTPase TypA [Candidatus Gracilibacteria bacterium]